MIDTISMTILQTIIIAIVEGLTEFLPVSSTGHMIIVQSLLGVPSTEFVKAFTVIIQFGAILSVVWLYWRRFFSINISAQIPECKNSSIWSRAKASVIFQIRRFDFYWKLLVAFIPAAVLGFLFSDQIDALLEDVLVVAVMLVLGGVLMLFVDRLFHRQNTDRVLTEERALRIGLFQCLAMIPGVSRSMATIVGGMSQGLSRKSAAEFSFFLAVPTMFAATAYKLLKLLMTDEGLQVLMENWEILLLGNVVAFVVALLAIKFFIGFVTRYGFKIFGIYRILVGGGILILWFLGYNLVII